MERTRVLWVIDTLAANAGTERQILELARLLPERLDLHIATFSEKEPNIPAGVRFAAFPMDALLSPRGIAQTLRLAAYIRSHRIELVQGYMIKAAAAAAIAGAIGGARVILTSRRNMGYYFNGRSLRLTRLANRFVTRLVANSEGARKAAADAEGFPIDRIDVHYNGVNMNDYYPPEGEELRTAVEIPHGVPVVGIVANYRPVKDLPLFLQSAAIVARHVPDAHFLLVGAGPLDGELRELAGELGLTDRTIFTSGKGDVLPYLHRMSVGCLSSLSEGFSNSILEYMAAGLPVVAVDVGGNREAIREGETGYLVTERTPEAFASPVIRLLTDEALRLRMRRKALERCRNEFEIGGAASRLAEYYESLLGRTPLAEAVFAGHGKMPVQ